MNRHPALSFCLSMISAQTLRVCREGKPGPTLGSSPRACFSETCSVAERSGVTRHPDVSALSRFNERRDQLDDANDLPLRLKTIWIGRQARRLAARCNHQQGASLVSDYSWQAPRVGVVPRAHPIPRLSDTSSALCQIGLR